MRRGMFLGVAMLVGVLVAGCSSSRHGAKVADPSVQVRSAYSAFFDSATPVKTRIGLVEDGAAFAQVLTAQRGDGAMSATVTTVTLSDSSHAAVSMSLNIKPSVKLPSVGGAAVLVGGKWVVSKSTLCVLLSATGQHAAACG